MILPSDFISFSTSDDVTTWVNVGSIESIEKHHASRRLVVTLKSGSKLEVPKGQQRKFIQLAFERVNRDRDNLRISNALNESAGRNW